MNSHYTVHVKSLGVKIIDNMAQNRLNEPDLGSNEPDLGSIEPDLGSFEPDLGSNEPDLGS
ncbi:hypothetical protein C2G38_2213005 [Gigaspora rosea]|uniref:Uncharacterized protein n=1 Tax=Gigaspora rosea TaxID=44941 RepID=A0A397UCK6_9GLOM|nr:hypothetical protein C2G38_2213005 [Gigaspora rosea]